MQGQINRAIENIYKINLGVKSSEKVLIFTDDFSEELLNISGSIAESGKRFADQVYQISYKATGCHGIEPPEELWEKAFGKIPVNELREKNLLTPLLRKQINEQELQNIEEIIGDHKETAVNAVIALSYFSTSHTRFRDLLNRVCKTRYASMPLFDRSMLQGPMDVDWEAMFKRTSNMAKRINEYKSIEVKSPNGTNLVFSKSGRNAMTDTGIITEPGSFSNLPAGEVYLAPLEGTANGKLVLDWAPTRKLASPITLHIKNGIAVKVEGTEDYVGFLVEKLSEKKENRNIAELGIGTNDKASRPDNILESEKIFGTIHMAFGDNSSFGGTIRTNFHQDFVFFNPTVTLIRDNGGKEELLKNGNLQS